MVYHSDLGRDEEEARTVRKIVSSLYLNLAAGYIQLTDLANALAACNEALELDPCSIKALYRRSRCHSSGINAGPPELRLAMSDLKRAYRLQPKNTDIISELARIRRLFSKMKKDEDTCIKGMFLRDDTTPKSGDPKPLQKKKLKPPKPSPSPNDKPLMTQAAKFDIKEQLR